MLSKTKNIKSLLGLFLVALYAYVFVFSPYFHEHHEQKEKISTESVSHENSCDLCKSEPVKTFTSNTFQLDFITVGLYIPIGEKTTSYDLLNQELFPNKAPPVLG